MVGKGQNGLGEVRLGLRHGLDQAGTIEKPRVEILEISPSGMKTIQELSMPIVHKKFIRLSMPILHKKMVTQIHMVKYSKLS